MKILILNGPNLNTLGIREPEVYGTQSLKDLEKILTEMYPEDLFEFFQSNDEGALVSRLNECVKSPIDGIVMNPAAFTHYSYAIRDAVAMLDFPVIEVHLSNIHARESFRTKSVIAAECAGQISGFGMNSYVLGVEAVKRQLSQKDSQ